MGQLKQLAGILALASPAFAAFSVYALHDPDALKASLGVTSECLSALNYTVECDGPSAVRATKNSDNDIAWSMDDLTTLCTDGCSKSLSTWLDAVEQKCEGEEVTINGLVVDPKAFPMKYISGYDLACLRDSNDNWCFYEAQDWDSGVFTSWDKKQPDSCSGENPPADCDKKGSEEDVDTLYVTNSYDKELYCSECFMLLWRQRIESPVFPQGNLLDHFTKQFSKLEAACSTKLSLITPAPTVVLGAKDTLPPATGYHTDGSTVFRYASPPAPTTTTEEPLAKRTAAPRAIKTFYTPATPDRTPQLGAMAPCGKYYNVVAGDTCVSISREFEVTMDELLTYNPELHPNCENLWANFAICVAPVSPSPMTEDSSCGENNAGATCDGSPFGSQTTNAGRCVPCGPEATAAPDAPDAQGQTVHDEEPPEEPHIEQPPKDVPAGDDDDRKKAKLPLPSGKYPLPSNSTMISKDGSCNEYISCVGSPFGVCCSTSGWCGYGKPWCGVGNCVSGHCDTEDEASGKP
ncbi:LysM domain-containing protein [Trichophyton interdigitale]|nr:LysM domain-containing protein [Trichophyton interdigitale]KAG5216919.1 LysM domain-containing protein [Trichophyton interdigitale]KAG8205609.1 LysM domain-containing protein [Trichophyton interdigitale]